MANSSIAISAGSGTNVDTRTTTTDGDHRQVVVIGDPATDAGVAPVDVALGVAVNLKGANGTALDTNSGLKSAGTTRVVIATDQPALTNKLLVTPDSVALPANQSVNVSQINGVTPLMGSGIMGTGSPRVTIASDNDALAVKQATATNLNAAVVGTGTAGAPAGNILTVQGVASMTKLLVTPDSVALPANQSVNVSQINGVAPSMGNGVSGTGVQRVTVASDSTGQIIALGDAAHNATDTGNPVKIGGVGNGTQPSAVTAGNRVNGSFDRHGNQFVRAGNQIQSASQWTQIHLPAANTQATKSQAAGAAGVRNVCTSITAVIAATATAPTAVQLNVSLIDGATGGTTYLWRSVLSLPATAGETRGIVLSPCWFVGTAATAMTLEFSAAGGANTVESVSMSGITITE